MCALVTFHILGPQEHIQATSAHKMLQGYISEIFTPKMPEIHRDS